MIILADKVSDVAVVKIENDKRIIFLLHIVVRLFFIEFFREQLGDLVPFFQGRGYLGKSVTALNDSLVVVHEKEILPDVLRVIANV